MAQKRFQIVVIDKKNNTFFHAGMEMARSAQAAIKQAKLTDTSLYKYERKRNIVIKAEPIK